MFIRDSRIRQEGKRYPVHLYEISAGDICGPYILHNATGPAHIETANDRTVNTWYWFKGHLLAAITHRDSKLKSAAIAKGTKYIDVQKDALPIRQTDKRAISQLQEKIYRIVEELERRATAGQEQKLNRLQRNKSSPKTPKIVKRVQDKQFVIL
jgi:hypothetical protein